MDEHGNILWADDDEDEKDAVGTSQSEDDNSYDWGGDGSDSFSVWWDALYGNDSYVPIPADAYCGTDSGYET